MSAPNRAPKATTRGTAAAANPRPATGAAAVASAGIPSGNYTIEAALQLPAASRSTRYYCLTMNSTGKTAMLEGKTPSEPRAVVLIEKASTDPRVNIYSLMLKPVSVATWVALNVSGNAVVAGPRGPGYNMWRIVRLRGSPRGPIVSLVHVKTKRKLYCIPGTGQVGAAESPPSNAVFQFRLAGGQARAAAPAPTVPVPVPPTPADEMPPAARGQLMSYREWYRLVQETETKGIRTSIVTRDLYGTAGTYPIIPMPSAILVLGRPPGPFRPDQLAMGLMLGDISNPVSEQMYGSCTANATALALRFALAHPRFGANPTFVPSRKWIYYMTRKRDRQTGDCSAEKKELMDPPEYKQFLYLPWFNDPSTWMQRTPPPAEANNYDKVVMQRAIMARYSYDHCLQSFQAEQGSSVVNAALVPSIYGVCSESVWPDKGAVWDAPPPGAQEAATQFKLQFAQRLAVEYLVTTQHVVFSIQQGIPVIFTMPMINGDGTPLKPNGVGVCPDYPPAPLPPVTSGHAMLIVGYDLPNRRFLLLNSWGKDWGMQGYCWFPFSWIERDDVFCGISRIRIKN